MRTVKLLAAPSPPTELNFTKVAADNTFAGQRRWNYTVIWKVCFSFIVMATCIPCLVHDYDCNLFVIDNILYYFTTMGI